VQGHLLRLCRPESDSLIFDAPTLAIESLTGWRHNSVDSEPMAPRLRTAKDQ
jgi:hypothetical protein